jgi:flagellar motility protein MotE (MotC chaperone)
MGPMLPSSRLLPATIVAISVVLATRVAALVVDAPAPSTVWAKTRQAVMTASVIPDARAAGPDRPVTSPPQPTPGSVAPSSPADPAKPVSPPQAAILPASHEDGGTSPGAAEITLHRSQIQAREQRLSQREAAVAAAEKRLADRVAELLAIQSHLQALVNDYQEHDDAKWAGLVKLYEGMRPRDAAQIFNGLDKPVLLEILARMKPAKAAPVIALMQPENARQVTADLAAQRGASAAVTN